MTSHFPSSSPSDLPALHLPPLPLDDNTKRLRNVSTVTKHSEISTHSTLGDINNHAPVTAEASNHEDLHAGGIAVTTHSSGPPQVGAPKNEPSAEERHWAAAVEYTAMRTSNWREIGHWKGFIRWVCICLSVPGSALIPVFTVRAWGSTVASRLANLVQT